MATPLSVAHRIRTRPLTARERHLLALIVEGALFLLPLPLAAHLLVAVTVNAGLRLIQMARRHT